MSSIYKAIFLNLLTLAISIGAIAAPGRTTYQAKIIKPDGYPLEANSVNFRFTILDPSATCILYIEDYTAVNMVESGGLISFSLGSGVRSFPASGTASTFSNVFDNSVISFSCKSPGIYSPVSTDSRKITMQFQDSFGWQTLPAMAINAVPYAMYATRADNSLLLNGKSDTDFVATTQIPTCTGGQALYFNGATFGCISASGGLSSVATSGSVLVTGGTASSPVISMTAASLSSDGYITSLDYAEFKAISTLGFTPVSTAQVALQIASSTLSGDVSGTMSANIVNTVGGKTALQISTSVDQTIAATSSNTVSTLVKRDASGSFVAQDVYANSAKINYVDIYRSSTSFNIRLQAPTSLSSNYILSLPTTSGTTGQVLSTDGLGNLSWINPNIGSVTSVLGTTNEISVTGTTSAVVGLSNIGTAGSYYKVSTDSKGRVTSGVTTLVLSDLPATILNDTSNFSGDISGTLTNITVNRIKGVSVTLTAIATNDILQYNGSGLVNRNIPSCGANQILTFNGTTFSCVTSINNFNGSTSATQTFAHGTTGTAPLFVTANGVHTLNIPLASAGSVTAGLLSNADYVNFNNKISSQWNTSGTTINYLTGNVGVGSASPIARLSVKGAGNTSATATLIIADSSNNSNFIIRDDGRVGVKTITPLSEFHTTGTIIAEGKLAVIPLGATLTPQTQLQVFTPSSTSGTSYAVNTVVKLTPWISGDDISIKFGDWSDNTNTMMISRPTSAGVNARLAIGTITDEVLTVKASNKFVGVGTVEPAAKLDVNGGIRAGSTGVATGGACAPEGTMAYDLTAHAPVFCNQSGVWAVPGSSSGIPAGTLIDFAGTTCPATYLLIPTSQTNVSRVTYATLFAAIGTQWGAGDGSTTFGLPWFPANYSAVQASGNVGTQTVGQVISHSHGMGGSMQLYGVLGGGSAVITQIAPVDTAATGGGANLAAGVRVLKCIKL